MSRTLTGEGNRKFGIEVMTKDLIWSPKEAFVNQHENKFTSEVPYTTETEKPIGTRDPDKFLKEQQDKLWKEMM